MRGKVEKIQSEGKGREGGMWRENGGGRRRGRLNKSYSPSPY